MPCWPRGLCQSHRGPLLHVILHSCRTSFPAVYQTGQLSSSSLLAVSTSPCLNWTTVTVSKPAPHLSLILHLYAAIFSCWPLPRWWACPPTLLNPSSLGIYSLKWNRSQPWFFFFSLSDCFSFILSHVSPTQRALSTFLQHQRQKRKPCRIMSIC